MPLVIPPGYAQISIELRNTGDPEPWYCTYGTHFSLSEVDAVEQASNHAQYFADSWRTFYTTETRVAGAHASIGSDGGNYTVFGPVRTDGEGTSTADKLPQNCSALIRKVTTRPGRAGKGRVFLPNVLAEGSVDNVGVITPTALQNLQAQADTWFATVVDVDNATGPWDPSMVLLHNAGIPGGTDPSPVVTLQADGVIATQRRRLRR